MNKKELIMKTRVCVDKMLLSKWLYVILSIVFIVLSCTAFSWGHFFKIFQEDYIADYTILGTYGDFMGGVLGTIFGVISVLLVIRTFKYQQTSTDDNKRQLEIERFHDLFFELLHLYQSQVADLCGEFKTARIIENQSGEVLKDAHLEHVEITYNNKDFFDYEKEILQNQFENKKSFDANQSEALKTYMFFYIKNENKIGAYYRTLFRIYNLIDEATLPEILKKDYLKIIRAQLTKSELFFLRYNALTYYGHPFIQYINKYNVLKHLPVFELLEFKDWWKDLDVVERAGLNIIFTNFRDMLCKLWNRKNIRIDSKQKIDTKYNIVIEINNCSDVAITINIDNTKESTSMEFLAFKHFSAKRIQQLLDCYIKEIFIYSHFSIYNKLAETYSTPIINKGNITTIISGIRNVSGQPLILKCPKQ